MGTPHQGGNGVSFGRIMINLASVVTPAHDGLLQHLERDSEWLELQNGQYAPIAGEFVTKFAYEEYATQVMLGRSILVSSLLPRKDRILTFRRLCPDRPP